MSTAPQLHPAQLAAAVLAGVGTVGAVLFGPAGTLCWPAAWIYLGIVAAHFCVNVIYLNRVNPELIAHRMRLGPGTKRWDIIWSVLSAPLFVAIYVVAGLDVVRYGWSSMPAWLWIIGIALFLPGAWLLTWSMGVNPFFEKTVRIQTERGHRVVDTGPYAYVRHPGYAGFFGWTLGTPLLLGSWCALGPALLSGIALVIRTALEDRTLRRELEGYEAYAERVRFRLIPGLW